MYVLTTPTTTTVWTWMPLNPLQKPTYSPSDIRHTGISWDRTTRTSWRTPAARSVCWGQWQWPRWNEGRWRAGWYYRLDSDVEDIWLFIQQVATTLQVQSQICPNESHCRLETRSQSLEDDWGQVARWRWERSSLQGWCQKYEILTQLSLYTASIWGLKVSPGRFVWL